jgi:hypothetical protein
MARLRHRLAHRRRVLEQLGLLRVARRIGERLDDQARRRAGHPMGVDEGVVVRCHVDMVDLALRGQLAD